MVMIEQMPLDATPLIGIPVQRHHVGEITRAYTDAPGIPVEDARIFTSVFSRQKDVQDVGIALNNCDIPMRVDRPTIRRESALARR